MSIKTFFETDDGERFDSIHEAEQHEDLEKLYQLIISSPGTNYIAHSSLGAIMSCVREMYTLQLKSLPDEVTPE